MMSDGRLTFEHGEIRLGNTLLPGVVLRISVNGVVKFDTADPDGMSGSVRTPMGWNDAEIVIVADLLSDIQVTPYAHNRTCYEKLAELNAVFKGSDNGANPKIFSLRNVHAMSRGVDNVVFCGLTSSETDRDDVIRVNLSFSEHRPYEQRKESRVSLSDSAAGSSSAPVTDQADPGLDDTINVDVR
ncbi:hypothetical protein [uncultured Desulfobacter sp.]|uniref:hypothetical protein n=1 Tax=uncultured Desulfobacter sp. TaxID=240139 RepID=UPI002AAAF54D|nr:hypothetical protein [uncultured Desulfobacter sp.]